ncbi:hypothetical protein LV84_03718 [Algoriphagus ratkowskyi]|uniref:Uncharacterized protein n=1 Tax=Algoriphagus ratkowskyi TaxID=57028 RepID=A0A2W7QU95_9BACT|nr:hypothetical protein [Algoriphagus ratkowskyi]PZX51561.1 hypothetical protein LV84_03718 [Algoriphagus ratkowskyi]
MKKLENKKTLMKESLSGIGMESLIFLASDRSLFVTDAKLGMDTISLTRRVY